MVLQEEEVPIWEAHTSKILTVHPQGHAKMWGKLLVDLISSGQLDVCKDKYYPGNTQVFHTKPVHFVLAYTKADVKSEIFMELPI